MVDPPGDEAEEVLLGVGGGVFLDPVGHPPRQGRDVAADDGDLDPLVEGRDVGRQRAAAGVADAADPRGVDPGQRGQVVEAADAVPDAVAGQVGPEEVERVAEDAVLAAGQVEARPARAGVPELAPLPLPDGVVGQDDVPPLRQVDVQGLVGLVPPCRPANARTG